MVGQMIVVGFAGSHPRSPGVVRTREQVARGEIGGVMLLSRNVTDAAGTRRLVDALQGAARDLPLLVAVDQEGGRVARLRPRHGVAPLPSAARVAATLGPQQAIDLYHGAARDLARFGFNLNFGPVVDVNMNGFNPVIGRLGRSFSPQPEVVARYARAFVHGHRRAGVLTALKHFPGHGSSRNDSHLGLVDVTATWSSDELLPFADLIASDHVDAIMTGHLIHRGFAPDRPATLSREMIEGLLRGRLGFDGVVIADDLQMGAIARRYSEEEASVLAVRAGVDLLLFSRDKRPDPTLVSRVTRAVVSAALRDDRLKDRIRASHTRILRLKRRLLDGSSAGANPAGARVATPQTMLGAAGPCESAAPALRKDPTC